MSGTVHMGVSPSGFVSRTPAQTVALPWNVRDGIGPFFPTICEGGRIELHDSSGQSWGIFATREIAEQTAAAFSR